MGLSLEQQIASLENQVEILKQKIEEQKQEKEWPKCGDFYSLVDTVGNVLEWYYMDDREDEAVSDIGNIFKTQEQAEEHVNYLKTMALLRKQPGRVNFYDGCGIADVYYGFCVRVDTNGTEGSVHIEPDYDASGAFGNIWFASEDAAQKALEVVGEDAIIAADRHEAGLGV